MAAGGSGSGGSGSTPSVSSHLGLANPDQTLEDILSEHEEYVQKSVNVFFSLMENEVYWSVEERHYIGMMAACRHKCSVLAAEQRSRFTDSGGSSHWLEGLHCAPLRLRCLHHTNAILAHRPWMFNKAYVQQLVKSGLSLSEIVVAVTIMAYFHAMSAMIHALGIEAASGDSEPSFPPISVPMGACASDSSPRSSELSRGGVAVLLKRMEGISDSSEQASALPTLSNSASGDNLAGVTGPELPIDPALVDTSLDDKYRQFSKYSPNMNFAYKDFYRRGNKSDAPTLKYQHLWEEMGFTTVAKFTSQELADCLDSKFRTASSMTYHTCGDRDNVNTAPFRRAVWNYTQCLFGIRRDDYDYSHINMLLDRHLKVFLKTMTVAPENLLDDLKYLPSILKEFKQSERIHVVILAAEARLQTEMVYAMLAVERYYVCS
ncbi:Sestrin [Trinorchestia longiramus]|nr:Sestrin [Trinorchestia longiramus]